MNDEQRQYYIDKVCSVCLNRDECDRTKFISSDAYDRFTMKCLWYEFDNTFEIK